MPSLSFSEGVDVVDLLVAFRVEDKHGSGLADGVAAVVRASRPDGSDVLRVVSATFLLELMGSDDASESVGLAVLLNSVEADNFTSSTRTFIEASFELLIGIAPE